MDVKQELFEIVRDYIELPESGLNLDEGLKFAAGIDSFVMFSMVGSIEDHFHITIPNDAMAGFKTLGDIVTFIEQNL